MQLKLGNLKTINIQILKVLFPEFENIYYDKGSIIFSRYQKSTFKYFLANMINSNDICRISFFELIVYHIPRRLSYHKSGNYSFSPYYMIHVIKILNENPAFLVQYLLREFHKIRNPFGEMGSNEFFEKLNEEEELFSSEDEFGVISDITPTKFFKYMK